MAISFEMNTEILPIVNVGMYDTTLGMLMEHIRNECVDEFNNLVESKAIEQIEQVMWGYDLFGGWFNTNVQFISNGIEHPQFYNYQNDRLSFILSPSINWNGTDEQWLGKLIEYCVVTSKHDGFFAWCKTNYGSYDGFISNFPYEEAKFNQTLNTVTVKNLSNFKFSLLLAMVILYDLYHLNEKYFLSKDQMNFETNLIEDALNNNWFEEDTEED